MNSFFDSSPDVASLWFAQAPTVHTSQGSFPAKILSAHPHGARLVLSSTDWSPQLAEIVNLDLNKTGLDGKVCLRSAVTGSAVRDDGSLELGIVFLKIIENSTGSSSDHQNALPEVGCPESFRPVIWGDHPWFFNYRLQMSVLAFSAGSVRVLLHSEARGMLPQLVLDFQLSLPGVGLFPVRARVISVQLGAGGDGGQARLEWIEPSKDLKDAVARYLFLAVPGLKPESLERAGHRVSDFDFAAVFGFAHTPEEMNEVLALRLEAYRDRPGSALGGVTDPSVMKDEFDDHSLVLSVRVGARLFGTTRLVFNNGDRSKSEIARFVELPDWIWENGFVELSRSATLADARGRDVFASLRRHALRVAYQSGFRYIVSDCEGHLLEAYKRRGAQELGTTFVHGLENKKLHVLYYDIDAILRGEVGAPETWAKFWKPMTTFLEARHGNQFPRR